MPRLLDLSADKAVDEAIRKARRSFFAYGGLGAFQGQLNPLSGRSIFESCVVPVLLYGCEYWFVTEALPEKLEAFKAEVGRRILKLSRYHCPGSEAGIKLAISDLQGIPEEAALPLKSGLK